MKVAFSHLSDIRELHQTCLLPFFPILCLPVYPEYFLFFSSLNAVALSRSMTDVKDGYNDTSFFIPFICKQWLSSLQKKKKKSGNACDVYFLWISWKTRYMWLWISLSKPPANWFCTELIKNRYFTFQRTVWET